MPADVKTLARIHRVRTVQLHQAHAAEAQAIEKAAAEAELGARIAALAAAVEPTPIGSSGIGASGIALAAAALYRDKLHQSAHAALQRLARTQADAERAAAVTRAARQDQGATEKLMDRARSAQAAVERRKLEDMPAARVPRF